MQKYNEMLQEQLKQQNGGTSNNGRMTSAPVVRDEETGEEVMNPHTMDVIEAYAEPAIKDSKPGTSYQFFRTGYYIEDTKLSSDDHKVFNQIVGLKSSWKPAK